MWGHVCIETWGARLQTILCLSVLYIGANTGCLYSLRCVGGLACIEAIDDILG